MIGEATANGSPWARRLGAGLGALALAWVSLALCEYRYGVADQVQYLSQYGAVRFPGTLDDDAYLKAFEALGSGVWTLIAWTTPEGSLAGVLLGVMLVAVAGSALILSSLGRRLAGGRVGVPLAMAPALVLVTPKEQNYFGLVSLGDVEFTATVLVLTLVFASMTLFVRGRVVWALLAAMAAAPIHGQTAAYLLAAWCGATIIAHRREPRLVALVIGVGIAGAGGVLLLRSAHGVDASRMDEYAALGRELYAKLIDIRHVPPKSWAALGMLLAFGVAALPGYLRSGSRADAATRRARERLLVYGAASLAFPLLGTALLFAGLREPLLWKLMVPRSLMLVQIAALVVAAIWCVDRIREGGARAWVGSLVLCGLTLWPVPLLGHLAAGLLGAGVLALMVVGEAVSRREGGARAGESPTGPGVAPWLVAVLAGAIAFVASEYPWLRSPNHDAWRDVQRWARERTPEGTVFVTPAYLAGWRVGSHRPTFGELRDGGLLFYAGEPVLAWRDRMALLGLEPREWWWEIDAGRDGTMHARTRAAYAEAVSTRLDEIVRASGAAYLVVERGDGPRDGEAPAYRNELFEVHAIGQGE